MLPCAVFFTQVLDKSTPLFYIIFSSLAMRLLDYKYMVEDIYDNRTI